MLALSDNNQKDVSIELQELASFNIQAKKFTNIQFSFVSDKNFCQNDLNTAFSNGGKEEHTCITVSRLLRQRTPTNCLKTAP